ncbi:MAG TPA: hypothetical protein VLA74_01120, partial [Nitrososphaeraceae archaeon]|nr:hypothetical protein [Nitrososphaeraceae archaeon]
IKFESYEPKALWLVKELIDVYLQKEYTFHIKEIVHHIGSGKMFLVDDSGTYYGLLQNGTMVRLSTEQRRRAKTGGLFL